MNNLNEPGLNPIILLHETKKEEVLARKTREENGIQFEIVEESNLLYTKGIIRSCHIVVGSRYHALINALSQRVPALATGWSHKYEQLYTEYGSPELLISDLDLRPKLCPPCKV